MGPLEHGDPERIGRYRLIGRLGAGGMGQVYFGRSAGGRAVAIKRIHPHMAADPSFRERFAREVTAARQVSGAFTAPVIDADPEGRCPGWSPPTCPRSRWTTRSRRTARCPSTRCGCWPPAWPRRSARSTGSG
ncbi:hypothetical protein ACFQXA_03910 [Nocardiopsis composta]